MSYTRVVRSTQDGKVVMEFFSDLTRPPVVQFVMSPDETDEVVKRLGEASEDARRRGGDDR